MSLLRQLGERGTHFSTRPLVFFRTTWRARVPLGVMSLERILKGQPLRLCVILFPSFSSSPSNPEHPHHSQKHELYWQYQPHRPVLFGYDKEQKVLRLLDDRPHGLQPVHGPALQCHIQQEDGRGYAFFSSNLFFLESQDNEPWMYTMSGPPVSSGISFSCSCFSPLIFSFSHQHQTWQQDHPPPQDQPWSASPRLQYRDPRRD